VPLAGGVAGAAGAAVVLAGAVVVVLDAGAAGAVVVVAGAVEVVAGAVELVDVAGVVVAVVVLLFPYMNHAMIRTAITNAPTMKYRELLALRRGMPGRLS
jgi:hypothetical protein